MHPEQDMGGKHVLCAVKVTVLNKAAGKRRGSVNGERENPNIDSKTVPSFYSEYGNYE